MEHDRLSEAEVAERAGTTVDRIRDLVELGVLDRDEVGFARNAVMRARVIESLERKGIDAGALADAMAAGELTLGYLESAGRRHPRSDRTFADLASEMDISIEALERVFVAFGLPPPDPDEVVREE